MKYEDDLRNATPERLAELLEQCAKESDQSAKTASLHGLVEEAVEHFKKRACVQRESARRLRELNKPTY